MVNQLLAKSPDTDLQVKERCSRQLVLCPCVDYAFARDWTLNSKDANRRNLAVRTFHVLASLATNQYSHFWLKGIPVNRHCMIVSDSYADSGGAIHSRFVSLLLCFPTKKTKCIKSQRISVSQEWLSFSVKSF